MRDGQSKFSGNTPTALATTGRPIACRFGGGVSGERRHHHDIGAGECRRHVVAISDHADRRIDAVLAGLPANATRIARLPAVLAGEQEGDVAVAAADQQPRGVDHAHLSVPRRDAAGN
jgi:hypothetical protein